MRYRANIALAVAVYAATAIGGAALAAPSAGKPIPCGPNATTWKDVRAALTESFRGMTVGAYEKYGKHDPSWDKPAEEFLNGVLKRFLGVDAPDNNAQAAIAEKLLALHCDDPLVLQRIGKLELDMKQKAQAAARIGKAIDGLKARHYPPMCLALAYTELATIAGETGKHVDPNAHQWWPLALAAYADAADKSLVGPGDHWAIWTIFENVMEKVFPGAEADFAQDLKKCPNTDPWLLNMVWGLSRYDYAWSQRGESYAGDVSADAFQSFLDASEEARGYFEKAYHLHPEYPESCCYLLLIAGAAGPTADGSMRDWFDRAVADQFDYMPVYHHMVYFLLPRWHGSHAAMLAFGKECLDTGRFDTDVPNIYRYVVDTIVRVDGDESVYDTPGVYENLRRLFQGNLGYAKKSKPDAVPLVRRDWAETAAAAGHPEEAQRQLDIVELGKAPPAKALRPVPRPDFPGRFSDDLTGKTEGFHKPGDQFVKLGPDGASFLNARSWLRYADPPRQLRSEAGSFAFNLRVGTGYKNKILASVAARAGDGNTYPTMSVQVSPKDAGHFGLYFSYYLGTGNHEWSECSSKTVLETDRWYAVQFSWGPAGQTIYVDGKADGHTDVTAALDIPASYRPAWWGFGSVFNKESSLFEGPTAAEATCYPFTVRDLRVTPDQKLLPPIAVPAQPAPAGQIAAGPPAPAGAHARAAGFTDPLDGKTLGQASPGENSFKWENGGVTFLDPMAWIRYTDPSQLLPRAAGTISCALNVGAGFSNQLILSDAIQREDGRTFPGLTLYAMRVDDTHYRLEFAYKVGDDWYRLATNQPLDCGHWYTIAVSWGPLGQSISVDGSEWGHQADASGQLAEPDDPGHVWWGIGAVYNKTTTVFGGPAAKEATCCPFSIRDLQVRAGQGSVVTPTGFSDPLAGKTVGAARLGGASVRWNADSVTFTDALSWIRYSDPAQQLPLRGGLISFEMNVGKGYANKLVISDALQGPGDKTYPGFSFQVQHLDATHYFLYFGYHNAGAPHNSCSLYSHKGLDTDHWYKIEISWGARGQSIYVDGKQAAHNDLTLPYQHMPGFTNVCWGLGSVFNTTAAHEEDPNPAEGSCYPISLRNLKVMVEK